MLEIIGTVIGIGLAYLASKWRHGRTLLQLGQDGLELAKSVGLDTKIPDNVRRVAEQAIIAANQAKIDKLCDRLVEAQAESELAAQRALDRGVAFHKEHGFITEMVEPTGDEPTSKPFGGS